MSLTAACVQYMPSCVCHQASAPNEQHKLSTSIAPADPKEQDVTPYGATAAYAAPEVLQSLQLQFEGQTMTGVRVSQSIVPQLTCGLLAWSYLDFSQGSCCSVAGTGQ